jgi:hypothetical protein
VAENSKKTPMPRDWEVKVKIWERLALGEKPAAIRRHFELNLGLEGYPENVPDRTTIKTICQELRKLTYVQLAKLPPDLKKFVIEKYPNLGGRDNENKLLENESPNLRIKNIVAHDKVVFNKLNDIITEVDIRYLVHELLSGDSYPNSASYKFEKYVEYSAREENKYIHPELIRVSNKLRNSVIKLDTFACQHFYPSDGARGNEFTELFCSSPHRYKFEYDLDTRRRYDILQKQLHKLTRHLFRVFTQYRAKVREILYI